MSLLPGFTAGLLFTTFSELGDKTFFMGALLAMRYPRRFVFGGVIAALAAMTILSALIGQLTTLFPSHAVRMLAAILFTGFGLKLLFEAYSKNDSLGILPERVDAAETVQQVKSQVSQSLPALLFQIFSLTFLAEWGDRTQFTTITLSAANNPYGVVLGAILGHAICAAIAVACGRAIAGYLSEKLLATIGGILFLIFGIVMAVVPAG